MAKATGTIDFSGIPANSSTIVINDGQGDGHSQVTFRMAGTAGGGGEGTLALDANGFSKVCDVYNSHTTSKGFMRIAFHIDTGGGTGGGSNADFKDMATGGTTPLIYEFTDPAGNVVNITLINTASFTADVSGASYSRKDSAGNYSINTNNAGVNHDNIAEELKDILVAADAAGEIVLGAISRQSTYWLQISSNAAGDPPFSFRIKRASGSWANTASPAATITKSTSGTTTSNIRAQITEPDDPVYSQRNAETGGSGTLTAAEFATYLKDTINGLPIQITATVSGTEVSLENDNDGSSGNVTITTSGTTNASISGMEGGSSGGGITVSRTKLNASQMKLHASGALAATGSTGELALDISGSMELITTAAAADLVALHDISAGKVKKIAVSDLVAAGVAGSDTQVQYNDGGSQGGAPDLTYNKSTGDITVGAATNDAKLFFRDASQYIYCAADDSLDLTSPTFNVNASTAVNLKSDAIALGEAGDTDVVLTFNANSNDGVLTWMEDEDYFKFSDDILMVSGEKVQFGDTGEYISGDTTDLTVASGGDIKLDATAQVQIPANIPLTFDGTGADDKISSNGTDLTIAAGGGDIVLDANDDLILDAGGDMIDFKKAATLHGSLDMSSAGDLIFKDAGGTEVMRLDGSQDSLLLADTKKIEFNDATQFIHAPDGANLTVAATTDINLESTNLDIDAASIVLDTQATDVDLVDNNSSALSFDASGKAGILELDTTNSSEGVKMSGYLTVQGNLNVYGTTMTVTSSHMMVQDSIIGLGVSGSGGTPSNAGDRGLIFGRGVSGSALPGFWYDGSTFLLATSDTSAMSSSFGTVSAYSTLKGGSVVPGTDATYDLGSDSLQWKDLYINGKAYIDQLGEALDCDNKAMTNVDINSGAIDGATIGANSPAAGTFLAVVGTTISGSSTLQAGGAITGNAGLTINAGTSALKAVTATTISGSSTLQAGGAITGNAGLTINAGTSALKAVTATTISGSSTLQAGGAITGNAGLTINAGTSALKAVTATTISGSSTLVIAGQADFNGDVNLGDATGNTVTVTGRFDSDLVPSSNSARDLGTTALQWAEAHIDHGYIDAITATGTSTLATVDIGAGAIDGTTIGASSAAAGTFTTLDCTDGAFAIANLDIDGATDIGAALAATDLIIVDDGAGGANRKCAVSRVSTLLGGDGLQVTSGVLSIDVRKQTFLSSSMTTGATVATLAVDPVENDSVMVYLNGILQTISGSAGTTYDYTLSGKTVTMQSALDSDDVLVCQYIKQ